jgi:hypothetical protein
MEFAARIVPKSLAIILLSSIITAVIMITRNPITGYELSIYTSLMPSPLILLSIPMIGGIGLIMYGVYRKNAYWQVGLLIILLSNLVIILLPFLKGYQFNNGGDNLSHLGFIKDTLITGYFSTSNAYPVTHILAAELALIINISPEMIIFFIGPMFYVLFVLFTYLCAKEILNRSAAILATTASTVLFCYYYNEIFPMGFAILTLPLILFLYFRNFQDRSAGITFSLIMMIILTIFFHPVVSFLLAIAFVLLELGNIVYYKLSSDRENFASLSGQKTGFNSNLSMISFFGLVMWIWYRFDIWGSAIASVVGWFNIELVAKSMTAIAQESFNKLGLGIFGQLQLFAKSFGHVLIYLALSLIAIGLIIKNRNISENPGFKRIFAYSCAFLPWAAVWVIDYFKPLTILSSGRMIWVVTAMFPALVGFALSKFLGSANLLKAFSVALVITICSLIGVFSLYPSPYVYQPYWGISHASFNGESWLVQEGNADMRLLKLYAPSIDRIADALWGTGTTGYPKSDQTSIIEHFGYTSHSTFGESITGNKYLFLVSSDKLLYTELWPQIGRFNLDDFAKLEKDTTVDHIYSNGEAQNYIVHGISNNK